MLQTFHLRGYRSLLDFRLRLGRITVVTGENGVGKSNLYRALSLIQRLADGRFAEAIAMEGGMPSIVWAGDRKRNKPVRIGWEIETDFFNYEMECGLIPLAPGDPTQFRTDPDVKVEKLRLHQHGKGREVARRNGPAVKLREPDGRSQISPLTLARPESMLAEIRDGARYPGLTAAREILLSWRFYHQFRTDADSPLRRPQTGCWSPVLAHDGSNLAATLQTIIETDGEIALQTAITEAFPGIEWTPTGESGGFELGILRPGLKRWMTAAELSDGTLRFFCLCAALLSTRPPPLLILNEPETSLHPELMPALAGLVASVRPETQILIVTHSRELAAAISERVECKRLDLVIQKGETRLAEHAGPRRVWTFGDGEEE